MNRTKGILAAGTLTGLVIITLLGLGFSNLGAAKDSVSETAVPQEVIPQEPQIAATDPAAQEAVQAWQDYSAELEQTIRVMQERENAYQAQIEAANQTIVQLQDQVNSANSAASNTLTSNIFGHEHEEHEGFEHDD
jgi:prophage DNA circulation protein